MILDFNNQIDEYIKEMPSLPVSVGKVLEICNSPSVNPSDLSHVISLDPVLTGRLLKLLNSAYYGLSSQVTSLARAIIMLGINTVKNLALSTAILATLPKNKEQKGLNMDGFWRHCLGVGVTAKLLAVKQGVDSKMLEEYFTAGLLHDIGKIPINANLSTDYLLAVTTADCEQRPLLAVENFSLGLNHCIAGDLVSRSWKLTGPVADIITHHHNPDEYQGEYTDILYNISIANYFTSVYEIGFSGDRYPQKPPQKVWEISGIKEDAFEELKEKVIQEIEKAKIFLKISQVT